MPDHAASTTAFLMFKPDPRIIERVHEVSGVDGGALQNATLVRYGSGLPLYLDRLDPTQRHTFRQVVTQGWFPQFGSQVCPECLGRDGIWQVQWRLPVVAVCIRHGGFLVPCCSGCGQRFRTHRHAVLRPIFDRSQPCGNSLGLRTPCRHSVLAHDCMPAEPHVIAAARSVHRAMQGAPHEVLGRRVDARLYLAELRNLATLLLHAHSRSGSNCAGQWAVAIQRESVARTTSSRGPRWGISPPGSAEIRGRMLAVAHAILSEDSLTAAGALLSNWLEPISGVPNGPTSWLRNRTKRTPMMGRLIDAATTRRHHVGRRLNVASVRSELRTAAIPQLIDIDIYRLHFNGMLGSYEWTGRMYVSLCLARSAIGASSWAESADAIGIDPTQGVRTARAASRRMRVAPELFTTAVRSVEDTLPRRRNFRHLESQVRTLADRPLEWSERWCGSFAPRQRLTSVPYALTWMWCEVAQASLETSPAWPNEPGPSLKAAYRAFAGRLTPTASEVLRTLVSG